MIQRSHLTPLLFGGLVLVSSVTAYFLASSGGTGLQSNLLADQGEGVVPTVVESSDMEATANIFSTVFEATPVTSGTGETMTGAVMTGALMEEPPLPEDIEELLGLRPAASMPTGTVVPVEEDPLEPATQEETTAAVSMEPVPTPSSVDVVERISGGLLPIVEPVTTNRAVSTAEEDPAAAALAKAPVMPQTGPELTLLLLSILCAVMGMGLLLGAPKHL